MTTIAKFEDFPIEDIEPEVPDRRINFTDADRNTGSGEQPTPDDPTPKRRRGCLRWWIFWLVIIAALAVAFYLRYCTPYVEEAQARGFITNVEKRGLIFKTFEGEMVLPSSVADTSRVYDRRFEFSIPSDTLARRMQSLAGTYTPVVVTYQKYYGMLPWRGATNVSVTAVEVE